MTFEEWLVMMFEEWRGVPCKQVQSLGDCWNAAYIEGQKAMRERAIDAIEEFDSCRPHYIAERVRALPIEGE